MPGIQGAIKNAILGLIKDVLGFIANQIDALFQIAADYLTSTPYPDNIYSFNPPTKGIWTDLYALYQGKIIILIPTLFGLALGLAMFFNIFSEKQKKQSIRRAVFAYPFAISWWWFGAWFLKFTNDLSKALLTNASLTGGLGADFGSSIGAVALGALIYTLGSTVILVIIAIYLLRRIAIYAYMVAMPLLLMLWIVPIDPVQSWAKSMMGKFVPLVLMTLPTALLLQIGSMFIGPTGGSAAAAAATGSSGVSEQLVSTILGFATIAGAAVVPKFMFSFSSGVSRAVRTGTRTGVSAARGARAGGAPGRGDRGGGAAAAGGRGRGQSRASGTGSGETADKHKHEPDLDFKPPKGRRRGQQERAAKVGGAARSAAKKSVDGAARATQSAIRNKRKDGSTVRGMGSDAKDAAVQGMSGRLRGAEQQMQARSREVREKFTPGGKGPPSTGQSSIDDYASSDADTDSGATDDTGSPEIDQEWMNDLSTEDGGWAEDWGGDSSPSTGEPAGDSGRSDREMESSDVGESSEEWNRADTQTTEFNTRTDRPDPTENSSSDESSDD